ncbi:nitrous-oxide reductase, partial [Mesorhizobium sp. M2D.F.Ca.ET.160.01.1.1]
MSEEEHKTTLSRRQLLGTSAIVAAAGATGIGGTLTLGGSMVSPAAAK